MLESFGQGLADNALTLWLGRFAWSFPLAEIFHLITMGIFFGGMLLLDLRLLGLGRKLSGRLLMPYVQRIAWWGFAGAVISGLLLFFVMPWEYPVNPVFQLKMGLILLAGFNALWMNYRLARNIGDWDLNVLPPVAVRVSAAISILLWIAVLACGRLIAYFYVTFGFF